MSRYHKDIVLTESDYQHLMDNRHSYILFNNGINPESGKKILIWGKEWLELSRKYMLPLHYVDMLIREDVPNFVKNYKDEIEKLENYISMVDSENNILEERNKEIMDIFFTS